MFTFIKAVAARAEWNPGLPVIILLFLFPFVFAGCRQNSLADHTSVSSESDRLVMDSIKTLDSLVNACNTSDRQRARTLARHALSLALGISSEEALARAYFLLGFTCSDAHADSGYIFYSRAMKIATRYNLEQIKPKIAYNLAMLHYYASNTKMVFIYLDSAILFSQRMNDYTVLSTALNALGNQKMLLMDTLSARIMIDSAYRVAMRHGLARPTGIALGSLARLTADKGASVRMIKKAIGILEAQPGNEVEIAQLLVNLGSSSTDTDTAIMYFTRAIRSARQGGDAEAEFGAYNNLAYSYLDKNDTKSAGACLKEHAIPLAEKTGNLDWLSTLYDSYKDVLLADKRYREALDYEQKALRERIQADQKLANDQVRLLSVLLDVRSKELRIRTSEKDLQEKQFRIRAMAFWFTLSVMLLVAVLFLVLWRLQRNRTTFQARLLESSKTIIGIEEDMKGRVAMELHDLSSPFYHTMVRQIEKAQITDPSIESELRANVSDMARSIREISHRMNNDFIGQLTLQEHVAGLCDDLQPTTPVPIRCTVDRNPLNLSREKTVHLYRIVQEILTNAIKYVTYGEINLSLSGEENLFIILYQDTGPGFDRLNHSSKGLGLMNIVERARIIGGNAVLITGPGKGTKWTITVEQDKEPPTNH